ncbi:putative transcriptional regulator [Pedobacter sp. UYEF25]
MERLEIVEMLAEINQQVSSSILGGMNDKYEELEALGLVKFDTENAQWSASLTQKGHEFLENRGGKENF